MKKFKEIRNINESPEGLEKKLAKTKNRNNYEKAIELMLGGANATAAAKKFKGVDAKLLTSLFADLNESSKLNEKVYKASLNDKEYQIIRKASMRGKFAHKFSREGETVSFSTNKPNLLVQDLERLVDAGAASWSEILGDNFKESVECIDEDKGPCWKGYKQLGMKKKDGKEVPNCVPVEEKEGGLKESIDKSSPIRSTKI